MSVAAPENISPVDPIVLLLNVCVSFANTNVSDALRAGMVAVLRQIVNWHLY